MITVAIADHFAPLSVFSRKLMLIRRFVNKAFEYRQKNNFDIEPHAPLANVFEVKLHTFLHFSSVSVSPRQPLICAQPVIPGFTLWRNMYPSISWRYCSLCATACGRGPTIDIPGEHVNKLRQFIKRRPTQEIPHRSNARIVLRGLRHHRIVFHHFH